MERLVLNNCLLCIGKCESDVGRLRQHCSGLYFSYVGLMQAGLLLRSDTGLLCTHLQQLSKQVVTWQAGLPSSGLIQTYGCHLTKFPAQPPSLKPGCESWVGTGIYEGPQLEHLRTLQDPLPSVPAGFSLNIRRPGLASHAALHRTCLTEHWPSQPKGWSGGQVDINGNPAGAVCFGIGATVHDCFHFRVFFLNHI